MKMPIDFGQNSGLRDFSNLVSTTLNATLETIVSQTLDIMVSDTVNADPQGLLEGYENNIIIMATEGKTGFEVGLIFNTRDITIIADLMLMGEGEPKDELDGDVKDSVMEIANQFFGALTTAVDTKMGKKFQFRVDTVEKFQSVNLFQAETYFLEDLRGTLKGVPFQFRFYADETISSLLGTQQAQQIMPDFFGGMSDTPKPAAPAGANMDMLMDIEIPISVRMGSAKLFLKDILGLGPGNIVELEQNASDLISLTVNGKIIARGEVVIVDGYFGFRIKEIISKAERIKKLKD